jgi:anti-sigma B factor antagonist
MYYDSLAIGVRHEPGYVILTVAGEIDIFTVARLRDQLFTLAADGRPLIVDLERVTFLGAAGLGALAGTARRAAARGASLHVVCARPQTRQLLWLTGLDRALRLARTLAEALQALSAAPAPAARPARPGPGPRPPARRHQAPAGACEQGRE